MEAIERFFFIRKKVFLGLDAEAAGDSRTVVTPDDVDGRCGNGSPPPSGLFDNFDFPGVLNMPNSGTPLSRVDGDGSSFAFPLSFPPVK
jgi:hypothetical protein